MWIKLSHTLFWKGIKLSRDKNNGSCISQAEAANMEKLDSAGMLIELVTRSLKNVVCEKFRIVQYLNKQRQQDKLG